MSNVLDLVDQTFFLGERATGVTGVMQCVWIYDRGVDLDGLRRFHRHLQRGRLSRRIERSALPFGRHRWVAPNRHSELEIVATPRPRDELDSWLVGQADSPMDPETGPVWHLAVQPFTDGGAAVSLVISHCLADGLGLCEALADAACGSDDPIAWPAAGSRPRFRALREDARQTAHDLPEIRRAVVAAGRMARHDQRPPRKTAAPQPIRSIASPAGVRERITPPTVMAFVDADQWDARAHAFGGTNNTLVAALAARLAQQLGRVTADGAVTLSMPISVRTVDDTRANAVRNVDFTVTPTTTDLREMRAATKQALIRARSVPDERQALLPLVPLLPKWLVRRMVSVAAGSATMVVTSNLGEVNPAACRADGTAADHFAIKGSNRGVTEAIMHRTGGILALASGESKGQVFVTVSAYQPGRPNTSESLRRDVAVALEELGLDARIGWPSAGEHNAQNR